MIETIVINYYIYWGDRNSLKKNELLLLERKKLEGIIAVINRKIVKAQENFDKQEKTKISIGEGMRGAHLVRQGLMEFYFTEIINLKNMVNNPYFGRINFIENNKDLKEIYIGKHLLVGDKNDLLIYDWRSPICSMYYDYSIGHASYK